LRRSLHHSAQMSVLEIMNNLPRKHENTKTRKDKFRGFLFLFVIPVQFKIENVKNSD
jgi:hypothetical protein